MAILKNKDGMVAQIIGKQFLVVCTFF